MIYRVAVLGGSSLQIFCVVVGILEAVAVIERGEVAHHVPVKAGRHLTFEHHGVFVEDFLLVAPHHDDDGD